QGTGHRFTPCDRARPGAVLGERMADAMKRFSVTYERDRTKWWVATVRGVAGVHTQGRSIEVARRRIRKALALAIGDRAAETAKLIDDVRLPPEVKTQLAALRKARAREEQSRAEARRTAVTAALTLTR